MSIYFGVFCCALSHIIIIFTIMMALKPRNLILRQACRLSLTFILATTRHFYNMPSEVLIWSPQLKLCAMIPLIYYSLCAFLVYNNLIHAGQTKRSLVSLKSNRNRLCPLPHRWLSLSPYLELRVFITGEILTAEHFPNTEMYMKADAASCPISWCCPWGGRRRFLSK